MAKREKAVVEEKQFGDFVICNPDKLERAINGTPGNQGKTSGGVGKDASPEEILAEYDRIGGLVRTLEGEKVATGSFWDFKEGKTKAKPTVKVVAERQGGIQVNTQEAGDAEDTPKKRGGRRPKSPADEEDGE